MVLFYCLPYNILYHLRDWSHGVERFALSECILFSFGIESVNVPVADYFHLGFGSTGTVLLVLLGEESGDGCVVVVLSEDLVESRCHDLGCVFNAAFYPCVVA